MNRMYTSYERNITAISLHLLHCFSNYFYNSSHNYFFTQIYDPWVSNIVHFVDGPLLFLFRPSPRRVCRLRFAFSLNISISLNNEINNRFPGSIAGMPTTDACCARQSLWGPCLTAAFNLLCGHAISGFMGLVDT